MELPLFYTPDIKNNELEYALDENASRHCIRSLRKRSGDPILLTDGKGQRLSAVLVDTHRKQCQVRILSRENRPAASFPLPSLAVSIPKNASRFEWLLEKAVEIGISEIIPLQAGRSQKPEGKAARFRQILISAMLQSEQYYLPVLHELTSLNEVVKFTGWEQRFIAHCMGGEKEYLQNCVVPGKSTLILIGPEGDFAPQEIELALENEFIPVSLGSTRLRTETAGVAALLMVCAANQASPRQSGL